MKDNNIKICNKEYIVAVVGVTGAVGEELLNLLDAYNFPIKQLIPIASKNSAGKIINFRNQKYKVKECDDEIFAKEGVEIAFFSAGGSVSAAFAKSAVKAGAVVIDNTSHFRMQENIPLVVPEVNSEDIALWRNEGIIANPNCSTIQMVQVLAPLHKKFGIKRVDVSTYQAVSGAGKKGMYELLKQTNDFLQDKNIDNNVFPHKIAFNLIPQIDIFLDNSYTKEELKMIKESNKIMHSNFEISATCVRVPVLRSHSEAISIKFDCNVNSSDIRKILEDAENIVVIDDIENLKYPMPYIASMSDNTYVGRIRSDYYDRSIIHLFCVADQIRVGAATNALRIAQKWISARNS
ncbi:aspartate-semialdehyde dehydrogenase [Helicobacter sp. MIT 14-3879]|uniref:aspartate-semialdehyde dehydrogenase n=1 Tax=Helicobacter sp. MIT 14-3879 TaxID=2040649 RepID=UPI000E1F3C28|nr:aspartate-semialdehyde dehydrogenase [Helicobacter sp. MIT 14-3879]RDU65548.1 aspartate-semialdehyde dehydrogenase [Helicobacter sp. MIT 14-3879]